MFLAYNNLIFFLLGCSYDSCVLLEMIYSVELFYWVCMEVEVEKESCLRLQLLSRKIYRVLLVWFVL